MCPPSDPAERDDAPGDKPARPRAPPPPDVGPRTPIVTADRTVVTRRPRPNHRAAEPHELLPTMRLPPVEARALRRQAMPDAPVDTPAVGTPALDEPEEVSIHSGEIEIESAAGHDATPPASDATATPVGVDARELRATVRVAAIPQVPAADPAPAVGTRSVPPPPRLHRPPLPLPDVLRQGPRTSARPSGLPAPASSVASTATPEPIPIIDTASLVLEVAESLAAAEPTEVEAPPAPATPQPRHVPRDRTEVVAPVPLHEPTVLEAARADSPAPSRVRPMWLIAAAAAVVATVWWSTPTPTTATTQLAPLHERAAFVAAADPPRALAAEPAVEAAAATAEPVPAPEPADPAPEPTPMPEMGPLLDPTATPPLIAEATAIEPPPDAIAPASAAIPPTVDDAPQAAPAPAKSKGKAAPRKPRKPSSEPKAAAAPPAPKSAPASSPVDAAGLLREAERAFADGRFGTALRNAQRSLALKNDPRAARILVLSACKLGRSDTAQQNFSRIPIGQRGGVRKTCKDAGVRVGL